jgi:hypothetical protein
MMSSGATPRPLRWFALFASILAVGILLLIPAYEGTVAMETTGGAEVVRRQRATLLAVNGAEVLIPLSIPVLAALNALVPWPFSYRRPADVVGALVCVGFTVLGAMTIGLYFVPTALALAIIAVWPRTLLPRRTEDG